MNLRFIGENNSMGLKQGRVYPVRIISLPSDKMILVEFAGSWGIKRCPYSSLAKFMENWEDA